MMFPYTSPFFLAIIFVKVSSRGQQRVSRAHCIVSHNYTRRKSKNIINSTEKHSAPECFDIHHQHCSTRCYLLLRFCLLLFLRPCSNFPKRCRRTWRVFRSAHSACDVSWCLADVNTFRLALPSALDSD